MDKNIGIDFGTTNTVIYSRNPKGNFGKIGGRSIKSAVYFITRDEYVIGKEALEHEDEIEHSQALVTDFKPNIMEKFDIVAENGERFRLKGEAVARLFLSKLLSEYIEVKFKKIFGTAEMSNADKTVITVPAKFDAEKKAKIKKAAVNAMFTNVGIAFEPTAAAIAASDNDVNDDIIAVYDFGGGTFDVSVIEKDSSDHYVSIDEDGDSNLGGNLITDVITEKIFIPALNERGIEIYSDIDEMEFDDEDSMTEDEYIYNIRTIKKYIETLKEYFSDEYDDSYKGTVNILINGEIENIDIEVTRDDFENAIKSTVQETVDITRRVVDRIKEKNKYVKKIIMAGGSSQLTLAKKLLEEEFEYDSIKIILSDSVFDLIAQGALLMAEQQRLIKVEEKTTTQFGVGVRTGIGIKKFDMLIDINKPLPVSGRKRFSIDSNILSVGEVEIPCYEKDMNNYPSALTERDKGIVHINTYHIGFDRKHNPSEIEVVFVIETDGTLNLSAKLFDKNGNQITDFNAEIMSDNELE